jgi:hypothetical protein
MEQLACCHVTFTLCGNSPLIERKEEGHEGKRISWAVHGGCTGHSRQQMAKKQVISP